MIEDQPNHMNQTKNPGKTGNGQTGVSLRGVVAAVVGCGCPSAPLCRPAALCGRFYAVAVCFLAYGIKTAVRAFCGF